MKTIRITELTDIENIILSCKYCTVALNGEDGFPYLFPMNFAYYNGKIILHSAPEGTHIHLLEKNKNISICFCTDGELVYQHKHVACSYRMDAKSVVCKGSVNFIEDVKEKESLLNRFMSQYTDLEFKYSQPALKNVKVWLVDIESFTARAFGQPHK